MATTQRTQATNAAEMLRKDHLKVKALFREYEELGDRAHKSKQRLAEQIFAELEIHTRLEEEVFYPAAREADEEELGEVVAEGFEEHHVADVLIAEIRALQPDDERFDAKMKVLSENIEHHIEEEETEMLPGAERALRGEAMDSVTSRMEAMKTRLTNEGAK